MKSPFPKTIGKNIISMTVIFTLVITLSIASFSYYMFNSLLSNSLVQSTAFNLHLISETISSDMSPIVAFSKWCGANSLFAKYLDSATDLKTLQNQYTFSLNADQSKPSLEEINELDFGLRASKASNKSLALSAWYRLQEEYRNNRSSLFIKRVIVSNASEKYLQLAPITTYQALNIQETITHLPYFQELYKTPSTKWIGLVPDPFSDNKEEKMLPIISPVYSLYGKDAVGWYYISISTDLLVSSLKNYALPKSSNLFLTIGPKTYQIHNGLFTEIIPDYTIITQKQTGKNTTVLKVEDPNGRRYTMVTVSSSLNGWVFSQTLSPSQFAQQQTLYVFLIILVSLIVLSLGFGLTYYLSHKINKPLSKIHHKIRLISQGDFSRDLDIEWQNELGEIGHGINMLAKDVVQLMDKRIEDAKEKNDLEYQMLQSQINPHFLYNTLNSIKWMATIQNASGIAEMTTALARLMKTVSKDPHQIQTIRDEIALLDNYFLIQKYRYGGTISLSYDIESDDLYDCQILKFTLQPMVENAIFHGIEPKGAIGHIQVSIRRINDDQITIDIKDDGIGMTEEQIRKVLAGESDIPSDFFKKIGIDNVKRRILYTFGTEYGLSITSVIGEFTLMTIKLPYVQMNPKE